METKTRLALQHIETGLFLSWSSDSMPHTKKLAQARRFGSREELSTFLEVSPYKPDDPESYEIIEIEITYCKKEVEPSEQSAALHEDAQSHGGSRPA
ncbi:hypothetical protein [Paenibacillus sp. GYB003]|uniref:hypothetical protein n=1 Tax=Paenibacillus sp. GYB003 TaxID=2994392 RepID=UPI002F965EF7